MGWQTLEEASRRLRVLSHPVRLKLIERLAAGPCGVAALGEGLGLRQPVLSQHLQRLRDAGIVESRAAGRRRIYRLADPAATDLLGWIHRAHYGRGGVNAGEAI